MLAQPTKTKTKGFLSKNPLSTLKTLRLEKINKASPNPKQRGAVLTRQSLSPLPESRLDTPCLLKDVSRPRIVYYPGQNSGSKYNKVTCHVTKVQHGDLPRKDLGPRPFWHGCHGLVRGIFLEGKLVLTVLFVCNRDKMRQGRCIRKIHLSNHSFLLISDVFQFFSLDSIFA